MKVTPRHKDNQLAVDMMFGKALCAYVNWCNTEDDAEQLASEHGEVRVREAIAAHQSEYEATVRCLAMLTEEHLPQVCMAVIEAAGEEFGILMGDVYGRRV